MGMDMLAQMLGGGQRRQEYQDFVNRYDTGATWDGISDREAYDRYQQVARQLPPQMYQESAQEAFSRLTPQQRMQLGQLQQQRPGILGDLLGGGGGGQGMLQSPIAKAALAGIAAAAVKKMMSGR